VIFQSKYGNYVAVYEPKDKIFMPGRRVNKIRGLRAEFAGPFHLFDSEAAARSNRWSEEEKQTIEKYLVSMPSFGKDLYLKPGQVVPDYLEEELKAAREYGLSNPETPFTRCQKYTVEQGQITQCPNGSIPGTEFCPAHNPAQPITGSMTTRD
jgi:hypothetical protein